MKITAWDILSQGGGEYTKDANRRPGSGQGCLREAL